MEERIRSFSFDDSYRTKDKGLRIVMGELIPQCYYTYPISDYGKNGEEFNRHPDTISGMHVYSMIIERYREDKNGLNKKIPDQNQKIWGFKRAEFWIYCVWLHYYKRDTPENVELCKDLMSYFDLDESIYFEMRDIAECYRLVTSPADKKDLDESIKSLIELG